MLYRAYSVVLVLMFSLFTLSAPANDEIKGDQKRLVYLVSDIYIPFWNTMKKGIEQRAQALGYQLEVYSANNNARRELEALAQAVRTKVDGIILSPTNSSAAVTILKIATKANIPVVISDIGAESDDYVSYIQSNNEQGAYTLGKMLARAMVQRGWQDGSVGIIAIPQRRDNGKARTKGFMQAMDEAGIHTAGLHQHVDFSYREAYNFTVQLITENPALRAIWLQTSHLYKGTFDAIRDLRKTKEILIISFDAEPEFIDMIANGELVGAGMQQPLLMGQAAVDNMDTYLRTGVTRKRELVPVLSVSRENIKWLMPVIRRNALGLDTEQ